MSDLDIIKNHLTPPIPLQLLKEDGSEDILYLKPLSNAQRIALFEVQRLFKKVKEIKNKNSKEYIELDKEISLSLHSIFSSIIKKAIPEIDEETLENFVLTNFNSLFNKLPDLIPKTNTSKEMDLIKKRRELDGKK